MLDLIIPQAHAQAAGAPPEGGILAWLPMIALFAIFYFFLIRPQIKRQKEHKKLVDGLKKGDEVQTMGGMIGKISEMGENIVKVEVADGVQIPVRRSSIEQVLPKGSLNEL